MQEMISEVDTTLCEHANEILSYYMRFSRRFFNLQMRQRVAHVSGTLPSRNDQFTIRKILSRVRGIHAIWDPVRIVGSSPPKVVDLGCGNQKQYPDSIGVDHHAYPGVNVVADIENNLPFKDNCVDHIFAIHILEHVHHLKNLMNEIHRVLKPDGVLHLMVPHVNCDNAVADPTHIRFFNKKTISFFCKRTADFSPFSPICVSQDSTTIYADLIPVKDNQISLDEKNFSYYFE